MTTIQVTTIRNIANSSSGTVDDFPLGIALVSTWFYYDENIAGVPTVRDSANISSMTNVTTATRRANYSTSYSNNEYAIEYFAGDQTTGFSRPFVTVQRSGNLASSNQHLKRLNDGTTDNRTDTGGIIIGGDLV